MHARLLLEVTPVKWGKLDVYPTGIFEVISEQAYPIFIWNVFIRGKCRIKEPSELVGYNIGACDLEVCEVPRDRGCSRFNSSPEKNWNVVNLGFQS